MGKVGIVLLLSVQMLSALSLERACLECHKAQQIPSEMIYKRYLMRYSTQTAIKKAMKAYVLLPQKSDSIMPSQFFLKFPMKEKTTLNAKQLEQSIQAYVERFDVKKRLKH
jgi:hypothetical protein